MKKQFVWGFAVALVILGLGIFLLTRGGNETKTETAIQNTNNDQEMTQATSSAEGSSSAKAKTYDKVPEVLPKNQITGKTATIKTSKGEIVFKFFDDAPLAASNFIFLAKDGFYDGLTFHRREEGFVIQGGDPHGNGSGGPGYSFNDEPVTRDYKRGIVAMANAGPNTNGSQFFIMLKDTPLPKSYTIFGEVTQGIEVVDKIAVGDVMEKVTID